MLKRLVARLTGSIAMTVLLASFECSSLQAQGPAGSTATAPVAQTPNVGTTDLERRLDVADEHMRSLDALVKSYSESNRWFITLFSIIVGLIVSVQSLFQGLILRHQWAREEERDKRDRDPDNIANRGAKAVAEVLTVVKDTMDTRLIQEKEAQAEAAKAKDEVSRLERNLDRVVAHFEVLASTAHKRLEAIASDLARARRHDFKEIPHRLVEFAHSHDDYMSNLDALAPAGLRLSPRVWYVRGIAAHYMSDPASAKTHLTKVAAGADQEPGETEFEHTRRRANAYYYLGINESNFGNYSDALRLLHKATDLDLDSRDLLTRLVVAECYLMSNQIEQALRYIADELDQRVAELKASHSFRHYHVPLEARIHLLKANAAVLSGASDWAIRVQQVLEPACEIDPDSYSALASLAQAYHALNDSRASEQFDKAYEAIVRRRHLETTTEVRSRILLLLVAGMCSQFGTARVKKRPTEEFLEEAKSLLDRLPRLGGEECTVFSPLSKRNENRTTLATHIGHLEVGMTIVVPAPAN